MKSRRTDPTNNASVVRLHWSFAGDEIPDTEITTIRRVHAEDPQDLSSPMHYAVEVAADDFGQDDPYGLSPAQRKVVEALRTDQALSVQDIGDLIAQKYGTGLRRNTISEALARVSEAGLAEEAGLSGGHGQKLWLAINENAGQ